MITAPFILVFLSQKVKEHLSGNSLISKLQVKHDLLKEAILKGTADAGHISTPHPDHTSLPHIPTTHSYPTSRPHIPTPHPDHTFLPHIPTTHSYHTSIFFTAVTHLNVDKDGLDYNMQSFSLHLLHQLKQLTVTPPGK